VAELKLVVVDGPDAGTEFDISGAAVIGRDPSSGIVLDDPESSRRHASVSVSGDTVTVEDLGSTNGTYVSGERITAQRTVGSGDRIRIGTTVLEVRAEVQATRIGAVPEAPDPQATSIASVPDAPEPAAAAEPPSAPEAPAPPEPPESFEPAGPPEPPMPEPPSAPEPPAAFEPPAPPEPPAEPEPAAASDPGTLAPEPSEPDDGGTLAPEPAGADEGATQLRPVADAGGDQPADEGATALRPLPGDMAPPPSGGPGAPPPPEPGAPPMPHYAEGPQASSPPPPPPPGGYSGDPGAPPPPPAFSGGPPPPPPMGAGPEAGGPPPPPPPGGPGPGAPPQSPPGYVGAPPAGGPLAPPTGFAPAGPMPPRNSVVEWLLAYFVPFYSLYWFHRSNKEMQAWSQGRIDYNATSSLLALTIGAIVIVPVFIAWSSYINRLREAQRMAGLPQTANFWGSVGRGFLLLYSVKWHQDQFNEIGQRPPQH
jgi:hypothetical protein